MVSLLDRLLIHFNQTPRIAILMSGQGSNTDAILKNVHDYPNLNFITIFTDKAQSNALSLSKKYQLQYHCLETNQSTAVFDRKCYFNQVADYLRRLKIDVLLYAGFMKITPHFFVQEFPGINIHPADLTILSAEGKPKYTGMHAISDAINNGESYLASTAHVVDCEVDCGQPLLVSKRLWLRGELRESRFLHELLKINCEHLLYPKLLNLLANGILLNKNLPLHWRDIV